jgi:hypothetical protein
MNTRSRLDDPQYWLERVEEISALAYRITDEHVRQSLFEIVRDYEAIAKRELQGLALPDSDRCSPRQPRDTR